MVRDGLCCDVIGPPVKHQLTMNSGGLRVSSCCGSDRLLASAADSSDNGFVRSREANEAEPVSVDATSVSHKHLSHGDHTGIGHSGNPSHSGDKDQSDIVDSSTSSPKNGKEGPCVSDNESALSSSLEYGCQSSDSGSRKESSENESSANTSSVSLYPSSHDGSYATNESARESQLLDNCLDDSSFDTETHEVTEDSLLSRESSDSLCSSEPDGGMSIRHVYDDHSAENFLPDVENDGIDELSKTGVEKGSLSMDCGESLRETEILRSGIRDMDVKIRAADVHCNKDGDEIRVVKIRGVSLGDGVEVPVSSNQNVVRRRDANISRVRKTMEMGRADQIQDHTECTNTRLRTNDDCGVRAPEAGCNVKRPRFKMEDYGALSEVVCDKTPVVPAQDCNTNDGHVKVRVERPTLPHEVGDRHRESRSDESEGAIAKTKGDSRSWQRREDSYRIESESGDQSCYSEDSGSEPSSVSLNSSSAETGSSSSMSVSSVYASVTGSGESCASRCPHCGHCMVSTDDELPEIARDISVSSANSFPVPIYDINSYGEEDDEEDISIESMELDYHYTSEDSSSSSEDSAIIVCTCCGCYSDCLAERGARVSDSRDDSIPRALVSVGTNTDHTNTALQQPNEVRSTFVQITVYVTVSLIL